MTSQLSGEDLCVIRGDRCLFRELHFSLDSGELLLIEGSNGSGKTSLLRAIAGLLELECGSVRWNAEDTLRHRQRFHSDMVWLAHRTGLKGDLTLTQNLEFESGLRRSSLAKLASVLERLRLSQLVHLPVRSLSAGQPLQAAERFVDAER